MTCALRTVPKAANSSSKLALVISYVRLPTYNFLPIPNSGRKKQRPYEIPGRSERPKWRPAKQARRKRVHGKETAADQRRQTDCVLFYRLRSSKIGQFRRMTAVCDFRRLPFRTSA